MCRRVSDVGTAFKSPADLADLAVVEDAGPEFCVVQTVGNVIGPSALSVACVTVIGILFVPFDDKATAPIAESAGCILVEHASYVDSMTQFITVFQCLVGVELACEIVVQLEMTFVTNSATNF